jgi:hypothetical protein
MKVTVMTDAKLKEMIASIQRAGTAVISDGLRMVIDKSLRDENEAEGMRQGGADEGNSEGEGAAQQAKINYLLAEPRLAEALDNDSSAVVQSTGQDCSPHCRSLESGTFWHPSHLVLGPGFLAGSAALL